MEDACRPLFRTTFAPLMLLLQRWTVLLVTMRALAVAAVAGQALAAALTAQAALLLLTAVPAVLALAAAAAQAQDQLLRRSAQRALLADRAKADRLVVCCELKERSICEVLPFSRICSWIHNIMHTLLG